MSTFTVIMIGLSVGLFLAYWLVGGSLFAAIAFMRMVKIRSTRFSVLFTLSSMIFAVGAAYAGITYGEGSVAACNIQTDGMFDEISTMLGCGVIELSLAGFIGFSALCVWGLLLMYFTRAENQSWMDSDYGIHEEEVRFDNVEFAE